MSDERVETIRKRHIRLGSQLGHRPTGLTAFEADVAHQDRAALLSALTAAEARAKAAEERLQMREELCELMMPIMEAAATKGIPMPPGWEARLRDLHARTLKGAPDGR
jgi:hypothetical protein